MPGSRARVGEASELLAGADLLASRLRDPDAGVRFAAFRELIALQDPTTIPWLIRGTSDTDLRIRRETATALGAFGALAREAAPALVIALRDDVPIVRQRAVGALGRIGGPVAANGMIARLERGVDEDERLFLIDSLGGIDVPESVEVLRGLLRSEDPDERWIAFRGLSTRPELAQDLFRILAKHSDPEARCLGARGLAMAGDAWAPAKIRGELERERSPRARVCLLGALVALGELKEIATILGMVEGADAAVVEAAIDSLGWARRPDAATALIGLIPTVVPEALLDGHPIVRALAGHEESARPVVVQGFADATGRTREVLGEVLATWGTPEDATALRSALSVEPDAGVRSTLRSQLSRVEHAAASGSGDDAAVGRSATEGSGVPHAAPDGPAGSGGRAGE